jgi:NADH:ubiquinone oxidoreductase subunit 4 (subunit M)
MFGVVTKAENRGLIDLSWRERGVMIAMIVPIIWIGLYPSPLLRRIEPAVASLFGTMEARGAVFASESAFALSLPSAAPQGEGGAVGDSRIHEGAH